jgi:GEVED domain
VLWKISLTVSKNNGIPQMTPKKRMKCTSHLALGLITSVLTADLQAQAIHDWGDAPDPSAGVGPMDYITKTPNGPRHKLSPLLFLGPVAGEAEVDGQPNAAATGDDSAGVDDEDAVLSSLVFMEGVAPQVNLSYFNNTGMNATLAVWVDWNQNGDFANDPSEQVSVVVVSKPFQQSQWVNLPAVPAGAANVPAGKVTSFLRVRLASDPAEVEKSFGVAENGEVEDHQILVYDNRDFGDLPDPGPGTGPGNYITSETAGGPYHRVSPSLRMGNFNDAELQALPGILAQGDDLDNLDDGDGVFIPDLFEYPEGLYSRLYRLE